MRCSIRRTTTIPPAVEEEISIELSSYNEMNEPVL
jgi:hypothetical protein